MIRYYRNSRGFDVFSAGERCGELIVNPAPTGVLFRAVDGTETTFASVSVAQLLIARMERT